MKLSKNYLILGAVLVAVLATGLYVYLHTDTEFAQVISPTEEVSTSTTDTLDNEPDEQYWQKRQRLSDALVGYPIQATFLPEPIKIENPNGNKYAEVYKVGTITNGSLQGETLYLENVGELGTYFDRAIMREGTMVSLNKTFTYPYEASYPNEIAVPGTPYKLKKAGSGSMVFGPDNKFTSVFTSPAVGTVSKEEGGECLVAELPDHNAVTYDLDIPFASEESGKLSLTLTNGTPFNEEYGFFDYSCGGGCRLLKYVKESVLRPTERLVQVATDPQTHDAIYGIASPTDPVLKELYNDKNTVAYFRPDDNWEHTPVNKYTYDEFIKHHPLLYWKDPWGRWVEFQNKLFASAAEKCKPVIYLYPEKESTYHVEVTPNGGFTKTIPEYHNGWDVRATPNSTLTDLATGLTYPYLYWSGMGMEYPEITNGWVVAKEDVGSFLDEKLYQLGLNTKEIADFKEYWVSRLSEDAFYKITFMSPRDFSRMAPLTVSPQEPNTEIRVMMTAQGSDIKVTLPALSLPPRPVRHGFVLVEWGGALLY